MHTKMHILKKGFAGHSVFGLLLALLTLEHSRWQKHSCSIPCVSYLGYIDMKGEVFFISLVMMTHVMYQFSVEN